ncbi:MAG: pilin [Candidatus Nomurabacteria bacterium]|nr:pilin [Candidatus Nomurabacteria bacterium]
MTLSFEKILKYILFAGIAFAALFFVASPLDAFALDRNQDQIVIFRQAERLTGELDMTVWIDTFKDDIVVDFVFTDEYGISTTVPSVFSGKTVRSNSLYTIDPDVVPDRKFYFIREFSFIANGINHGINNTLEFINHSTGQPLLIYNAGGVFTTATSYFLAADPDFANPVLPIEFSFDEQNTTATNTSITIPYFASTNDQIAIADLLYYQADRPVTQIIQGVYNSVTDIGQVDSENITVSNLEPEMEYGFEFVSNSDPAIKFSDTLFASTLGGSATSTQGVSATTTPWEPTSSTPTVSGSGSLVACDGPAGTGSVACGFSTLLETISRIINFILFTLATPLFTILFIYAGVMYMSSGGNETKRTQAKTIIRNVVIGYVIAIAAWLIVATLLRSLGVEGTYVLLNFTR